MDKKKKTLRRVNIIWVILMLISSIFECFINERYPNYTYLSYVILIVGFAFLSLIVYYLSIMADALSKRTKELEERERKINDKK